MQHNPATPNSSGCGSTGPRLGRGLGSGNRIAFFHLREKHFASTYITQYRKQFDIFYERGERGGFRDILLHILFIKTVVYM